MIHPRQLQRLLLSNREQPPPVTGERQRILTYTLNSVTKKMVGVLFLLIGLFVTGHAILTPMLMVIILLTGDFLGMSVAKDNVRQSPTPNRWQIGKLTIASAVVAACLLTFCTGALLFGKYRMMLGLPALQTLSLIAFAFGSEGALYSLRDRRRIWSSRPGTWVIVSSIADVLIISFLAVRGIAMQPLPLSTVAWLLLAALIFAFVLDIVKSPAFRRLHMG